MNKQLFILKEGLHSKKNLLFYQALPYRGFVAQQFALDLNASETFNDEMLKKIYRYA